MPRNLGYRHNFSSVPSIAYRRGNVRPSVRNAIRRFRTSISYPRARRVGHYRTARLLGHNPRRFLVGGYGAQGFASRRRRYFNFSYSPSTIRSVARGADVIRRFIRRRQLFRRLTWRTPNGS